MAQVVELATQLRGLAGKRQVPNCKIAMQHNIGGYESTSSSTSLVITKKGCDVF